MNGAFWSGKKVLVTGHTGFKGSWLSLWLQKMGAEVTGFSIGKPTNPCLFDAAGVGEGMTCVTGDVRNAGSLQECVLRSTPEIVIHMAAQSLVRPSYADPIETYSTNVMGTVNILEAARHCESIRVVVVVTSDKCYENREWRWAYRENEALGGHDPYSSSKGCAEIVTAAYRSSYFNEASSAAVATARAGNVIGGGDWATDRVIPDIVTALLAGRPAKLRNPHAVRPWQFVLEALYGYLLLAEQLWAKKDGLAGAWNFGPGDGQVVSVGELADQLVRLWGNDARWECDSGSDLHEATYLKLDSSNAREVLGWAPTLSLPVTLDWIVAWYRDFTRQGDAREITLTQLQNYQESLST